MPLSRSILTAFVLALTSACSTSDSNPTAPPAGGGRQVEANPSFNNIIQEIFDRRGCSGSSCHGVARSGALDLRVGNAHGNLVNIQALLEPILRVIPGDADGSYLVIKLEGRQSAGSAMPRVGSPLDVIDLTNIKNWINQGAQNN